MPIRFQQRPGLVAYITVGDPDLATSRAIALAAIDAGADVIELGVPFSDPVADGPVIQRASERALQHNVTLADVLHLAKALRSQRPEAGLVIFSYLNPVLQMGLEEFCAAAQGAGVDGVLLTDMTIDEAEDYISLTAKYSLAPIFLAAPTSTDGRLQRIATSSRGFLYAISRTGITGTQQQVAGEARLLVERLRRYSDLPIAVGFGISSAEHVAAVGEFADAAVVGSAIVATVERSPREDAASAVRGFIAGLRVPQTPSVHA